MQDTNNVSAESADLIRGIKHQGDSFNRCQNLAVLLQQLYKKKYDKITIPPINKRTQIFVAMRIDEKQFNGSIIGEITAVITDSIVLAADLTGNRSGVYFEAGIARGLQLCNHPIKLILTCKRDFFNNEKVHFDVSGDNIILYNDENDLYKKLTLRLQNVMERDN